MTSPGLGTDSRSLVLQATDIVNLIGQTVALKKRGKDYVGLCPFHSEKSPSFTVSPTKQFFHCYGCKAGGTAIDFVMKRDRVEFMDALRVLAEQAGIELPKFGGASKEKAGERQMLLDANASAAMFFEKLLQHERFGADAREYLKTRGFTEEIVRQFQVGVAVESWDALKNSQSMKKYPPHVLATAGLLKSKVDENTGEVRGYYDTFRNRLMFPIRDENGRTIAFGGRVMPGSKDPAKYLNSPETPVFSKGRCVFGLDQAKKRIVETNPRTVAVVEGYTDVVMAHQYGATNVVSVLGTAMTEQHVAILRRFADRIVLLFDPDTAGDMAMNRAVELFLTQPVEIAIATLPEELDPDEFLLKYGLEAFEQVLANAQDALTYKWKQLAKQFAATGDLTGQQKAVQQYLEMLATAKGTGPVDPLRWGQALARVSRLTEIPVEDLNRRFRSSKPQASRTFQATQPAAPKAPEGRENKAFTAQDRAERQILGILLAEPGQWQVVQQHVHVDDFTEDARKALADAFWHQLREEGETEFSVFLTTLTGDALRELAMEVVTEVNAAPDKLAALEESVKFLVDQKKFRDERKSLSKMTDEIELLRKAAEQKRNSSDPWRVWRQA